MIKIEEKLAEDFICVRADLYEFDETPFVVGIIYKPYSLCFQKTRK